MLPADNVLSVLQLAGKLRANESTTHHWKDLANYCIAFVANYDARMWRHQSTKLSLLDLTSMLQV